jgi:hypothetical protein
MPLSSRREPAFRRKSWKVSPTISARRHAAVHAVSTDWMHSTTALPTRARLNPGLDWKDRADACPVGPGATAACFQSSRDEDPQMRVTRREHALPIAWLKPSIALGFLEHLTDGRGSPFERRLRDVEVGERPGVERAQSQQTPIRPDLAPRQQTRPRTQASTIDSRRTWQMLRASLNAFLVGWKSDRIFRSPSV